MGSKFILNIRAYGTIILFAFGLVAATYTFDWKASQSNFNTVWLVSVLSVSIPGIFLSNWAAKIWDIITPIDVPTLWEAEVVGLLPVLFLTPVVAYVGGLYGVEDIASFVLVFLSLMALIFVFGYSMLRLSHHLNGSPDLVHVDREIRERNAEQRAPKPIKLRGIIATLMAPIAYMASLIFIVCTVVMLKSLGSTTEVIADGNIVEPLMNISTNMYGVAKGLLACGLSFMFMALICKPLISWGRGMQTRFLPSLKGNMAIHFGLGLALLQTIFCVASTVAMYFITPERLAQFSAWSLLTAYAILIFSGFVAGAVYSAILGDDGDYDDNRPVVSKPNLPSVAQTVSDQRRSMPQRWQPES